MRLPVAVIVLHLGGVLAQLSHFTPTKVYSDDFVVTRSVEAVATFTMFLSF